MSNTQTPAFRIYAVSGAEGKKTKWKEIGAAWPHKDGKGFNLQFEAFPLPGAATVLRVPSAKPA